MEPPPAPAAASSLSSTVPDSARATASATTGNPTSAAPGFKSASSVLRTTHAPSLASNRNASGGLPPVPKTSTEAGPSSAAAPVKPVNRPAASKNAIVYSVLQRRNPLLPMIRNVGLEIGDIVCDYQVGAHNGVLFLSLKYHRLHPEYIFTRIEKMKNAYSLRILLILCDITEHQQSLRELSKHAIINDFTILVAFSNEEAAQYLTTLKAYEHKSADTLKEKVHQSYHAQLEHVLTSGRKVNKSNVEALAAQFGSFGNMAQQSNHALGAVKGLGKVKIVSLLDAFNKPFIAGGRLNASQPFALEGAVSGSAQNTTQNAARPTRPTESASARDADSSGRSGAKDDAPPEEVPETATTSTREGRNTAPSPDWPSDDEDEQDEQDEQEPEEEPPEAEQLATEPPEREELVTIRQRERVPSPPSQPRLPTPPQEQARLSTPPTPRATRSGGPSRSPSVGEDDDRHASDKAWADPLADDDGESESGDERPAKRARV